MNVTWIKDEAAEAVIENLGLEFSCESVNERDIDRKESVQNRARDNGNDKTREGQIRLAADQGIPMPKIVIRRSKQKLIIAGGNHRFNDLIELNEDFPAYVVECTDVEFEHLARVLNTVVGVGMSASERVEKAVDAVLRLGLTKSAAASQYKISVKAITVALAAVVVSDKMQEVNPRAVKYLSQTILTAISPLSQNRNILSAIGDVLIANRMTGENVRQLVKDVNQKTTEADAIEFLKIKTRGYHRDRIVPRKVRQTFLHGLSMLKNTIEKHPSLTKLEISSIERGEVIVQCQLLIKLLNSVCKVNG